MSSEIHVTPHELYEHNTFIQSQVADTTAQFNAMKARLEALSSQFQGKAATAFEQHWNEWHTNATGLIDALDGLGSFLKSAAEALEDVDNQLASGLNG